MRRLARVLASAAVALAALCLAVYLSDPWYWKRLFTFPRVEAPADLAWFQPSESVPAGVRREWPVAAPDGAGIPNEALADVLSYATQTNSLALLVWHRDALVLERYWSGQDADSRTDSGGIHATILALLYGVAIDDGLIPSLDEPVASYLPEWRHDARGKIRIRDLLAMASGLELSAVSMNPWNRTLRLFLSGNVTTLALGTPLNTVPGTQFEYSNVDAEILGIALQRASGKRYARYLSERLWSRLGTGAAAVWLDHEAGMARTFCCLQASARDWLAIGRLILDSGRVGSEQVVPAAFIAEMLKPSAANPHFGLEIWMGNAPGGVRRYNSASELPARQSEPFLAPDVALLDGGGLRVYIVPSQQLVIVRVGARRADWDDARLPNAILRAVS
jgi:CubicO group peptidase (beta-lactamase class C family)